MNKKKQILIVEDNEINQEIISSILENDFNVLKANDGLEALKIIKDKRNSISLIMTDVNMPNMNGYELLDEIKKNPQYSLIPTIVLTQSNNEDEEILALQHGANDFLTKPYRPQIILHRANNLINFIINAIKNQKYPSGYWSIFKKSSTYFLSMKLKEILRPSLSMSSTLNSLRSLRVKIFSGSTSLPHLAQKREPKPRPLAKSVRMHQME